MPGWLAVRGNLARTARSANTSASSVRTMALCLTSSLCPQSDRLKDPGPGLISAILSWPANSLSCLESAQAPQPGANLQPHTDAPRIQPQNADLSQGTLRVHVVVEAVPAVGPGASQEMRVNLKTPFREIWLLFSLSFDPILFC